jgi:hypothetical protein
MTITAAAAGTAVGTTTGTACNTGSLQGARVPVTVPRKFWPRTTQ